RVVANRVREAIGGVDARVGVSFGMASWPDDGGSKDVLLASADAALYAMKGGTRRSRRLPGRAVAGVTGEAENGPLMRERLAMASRLSSRLAPVLAPERIAEVTVGELHHAFDYLAAYVQRIDAEAGLLRTVAVGGTITEGRDVPLWTQPLSVGIGGRVARTGQVALVHDTALDPDYLTPSSVFAGSSLALQSALSVPLHVGGHVWGVLSLADTEAGAFTSDDVLLLETVGAQVAAALHRSQLFAELDGAFATTLGVLSDALEAKDAATASHAHDVGELAFAVGVRLGLDDDALRDLRYGALLHDVGKIAVPTEILRKPAALTPEERAEIERHTIVGAEMLARIPFFERIVPLVRSSHERWDGGGYPDRLAGDAIPLGARIVCACDAFDAMTTDRPYRAARTTAEALEELRACAGTHFDPAVVAALSALIQARQVAGARTA
ncbi:MAG TPA: HD domain-containing phosphohydrolase, partial [Solirubrobacteraceae bacterium]|nr:HD domain-containing phosphohydrolase [Solirubrobacteraceae bacterium]